LQFKSFINQKPIAMKGRILLILGFIVGIVACTFTCAQAAPLAKKSLAVEHILNICPVMAVDMLGDQPASLVVAACIGTPSEGYVSVPERPPLYSEIIDSRYVRWRISYLRINNLNYSYLRYTEHFVCSSGGNPYWCS
jgi:hypothetical protein